MAIFYNHKCALVHIPKCGGTTIISILSGTYTSEGANKVAYATGPHYDIMQIKKSLGTKFGQYYKFGFVRNPWDRAVSLFAKRCKNRTFKQFISAFKNSSDFDPHSAKRPKRYYVDWFFDKDGNKLVDFIGRFENFDNDVKKICKKLSIDPKRIPKLSTSTHKRYTEYYDKEDEEIIRQRFNKDIEYFGYKFKP